MLRTGKEHLESLRDGRVVYIGSEQVDDVTRHPAFRNAAATVAAIYDMKADPANRDAMSYEEDGGRHSIYFLRPRTPRRPAAAHDRPSQDRRSHLRHVRPLARPRRVVRHRHGDEARRAAGAVRACRQSPALLPHIRDNDIYVVYAVVPPQAARNPEFYHKQNIPVPTLRVVREDDDGVVISGMKMLATGALYANEIWIGNVIPLAPDQKKEAITCAVPCNAPGLTLWSRKPAVLGLHLGIRFARSPGATTKATAW